MKFKKIYIFFEGGGWGRGGVRGWWGWGRGSNQGLGWGGGVARFGVGG